MVPKALSHYTIFEELGRGGMGIVYKARDTKLDRDVAIKVLPSAALASADDRQRFYREAKSAAQLHHPNIASIFEIDEAVPEGGDQAEPRPFIAMEYIDGETLEARIKRGPLKLKEAVRLAIQIAGALGEAHDKGIVHRDVKTSNVMLTSRGDAKVLDFGLALTAASTKLTRMNSTLGTVAYMSPEQARGEDVDRRTDLWSLGVVVFEMVVGRNPFGGDYEQAVVYAILNTDPEPLTAVRTGVPMELERIANKALAKDADLRYQTAAGLIADLKALDVADIGVTRSRSHASGRNGPTVAGLGSSRIRAWLKYGAVAVVALVAGLITGYPLGFPEPAGERYFREDIPGLQWAEIAPDNTSYAYMARDTLWYRPFRSRRPIVLSTVDEFRGMFWSPRSDAVGLIDGDIVRSVRTDGTGEFELTELPSGERLQGAVWSDVGGIFVALQFGGANGAIFQIPEQGGDASILDTLTTSAGDFSVWDLEWLSGPGVLIATASGGMDDQYLRVVQPKTEAEVVLSEALGNATRTASSYLLTLSYDPAGYLVYSRSNGYLSDETDTWVLPIDPDTGMPRAAPFVLFADTWGATASGGAMMSMIERAPSDVPLKGVFFNPETAVMRTGIDELETAAIYPLFHPSGDRFAAVYKGATYILSLDRQDARQIAGPLAVLSDWDEEAGILASRYVDGNAGIFQLDPVGSEPDNTFVDGPFAEFYAELSPDRTSVIYYAVDPDTGRDIYVQDVDILQGRISAEGTPILWYRSRGDDIHPRWHPSGNWVAFGSNETGDYEVYVRSYPDGQRNLPASIGGGIDHAWSPDGRSLYYRGSDSLYVVDVLDASRMRLSRPRGLLSIEEQRMYLGSPLERSFDVHPTTGEVFYSQIQGTPTVPSVVFVDNWKSLSSR